MDRCSRCKVNGHATRNCPHKTTKPWPFHEDQECDRCGGDHETGAKKLCKSSPSTISCKHCGHEKDHQATFCPIKDIILENIKQYTKTLYEKAMDSDEVKLALATSMLAQSRIQTSRESGIPHADVQRIMKSAIAKITSTYSVPAISEQQQEIITCAKANLDIAPYAPSRLADGPEILANSFKIEFSKNKKVDIRKYRIILGSLWDDNGEVQVDDGIGVKKKRPPKKETMRAVIEDLLLDQFRPSTHWASDFHSHIVSAGKLYPGMSDNQVDGECYEIDHYRIGRGDNDYRLVKSMLVYEGKLQVEKLSQYISTIGSRPDNYLPDEDLRILNLIVWKDINMWNFPGGRIGKKFFPGKQDRNHEDRIFLDWKDSSTYLYDLKTGFFSSVRPSHGQLLLNVNTAMSAFLAPTNLQTWINSRWELEDGEKLPSGRKLKELAGIRVTFEGDALIDGRNGTKRKSRIIRSFSEQTVEHTRFSCRISEESEDTVDISVFNHMTNTYPQRAGKLNKDAVCVNLGGEKKEMWYPADKLTIADWQMVKLDEQFADQMVKKAEKIPAANKMFIKTYALPALSMGQGASFHKDFGLTISSEFFKLRPRILHPPQLNFGGDVVGGTVRVKYINKVEVQTPASWNMTDVTENTGFYGTKLTSKPLGVIRTGKSYNQAELNDLKTVIPRELKKYYLKFTEVTIAEVILPGQVGRAMLKRELDLAWNKLKIPSVIIVQLPYKDLTIYADLKWWGDCDKGVATSCITAAKFRKQVRSPTFWGNIVLKINIKTGGTNHRISHLGVKDNTMIVGADVTHPGRGAHESCPSLAGIVATHDHCYAQYLASARLQKNKNEHLEDLHGMMRERLTVFRKNRAVWPDHILFYRDGVSESQYGMVKARELPQIRDAIREIQRMSPDGRNCKPKVTLLIVGKRHHMRFYPEAPEDQKSLGPGNVVDTGVVIPHAFNFYLQSHDSLLGTTRAAHYVVLVDESGYGGAELQAVTHDLCSLGSRAMHALSVCTPARYADLLCDRLRLYMKHIMEGRTTVPGGDALATYRRDGMFWGAGRNRDNMNPWHDNVKDIMFYL